MTFTLIIPYYRDYNNLRKCLQSLQYQDFDNKSFEIIIVNNDPDINLTICPDEFKSVNFSIIQEMKPGSYAARNKGIKEAKGEVLVFTDSDCLPSPQWLQRAYEIFKMDVKGEIGVLTGPVPLFYRDPVSLSDAEIYEKYTGFTTGAYAKDGYAITANWFSYKPVIEEFGCFNSNLKSNGDSELSSKISQKYQIVYCPDLVVQHPSRYFTFELVNKYRRILGGTYSRKYKGRNFDFLAYVLNFLFRRYRFSLRKFFSIPLKESWAIFKVCNAINLGAVKEYFHLVSGGQTKR